MIPISISVLNFGAIEKASIDFSGLNMAVVLGPNGRGKSTMLTKAPLYALYGVTELGPDSIVKTGTTDAMADFTFEHQGDVYRTIRTRSTKGKGKSSLEFQKQEAGQWISKSGTTIAETQKKIIDLLNLDADTFTASSMIMQGKANEFTAKPAGQRKEILTKILGLEIYATLMELAKEKARAVNNRLENSKQTLDALSEKISDLPAVEADLQLVKNNIDHVACDIRTKETELADVQAVIKDLEAKEQEAKQIEKQIDVLVQEMGDKQEEAGKLEGKIKNNETILESEPLITAKVAELEEIKAQIPALQAKEDRIQQLKTDAKKLVVEGTSLNADRRGLDQKIEALEHDLSCRDELKQASKDYQQGLVDLKAQDLKAEQWNSIEKQKLSTTEELRKLYQRISELELSLQQNKKKTAILQNSGCVDSQNAHCLFLKDAQEANDLIPSITDDIKRIGEEQCNPLQEQVSTLMTEREALQYDSTYHADLKKRTEQLRQKAELYSSLSGKEEVLQNLNGQRDNIGDRIKAIQEQVDAYQVEITALNAETENLPILKAKIPSLEQYVAMKDKLPEAKAVIKTAREQIAKLDSEIANKNEERKALQTIFLEFSNEVTGRLPDKIVRSNETQQALKTLQAGLNNLYVDQGTYQFKLDELRKASEEHAKLSAELAPKAKELVRWQTLMKANSKNGIPALIIENAIPELERISNDILSQMTNGENSLRFETQRDLKSKDGVAETLDIIIADWTYPEGRPYETFSGGEKLRIDLAIRFGLAELLANRAGSKVEFVVGDEVLSSQDSKHRKLVVDAIKAISGRFKMIMLISHIAEIQSEFDQRIVFTEDGQIKVEFN